MFVICINKLALEIMNKNEMILLATQYYVTAVWFPQFFARILGIQSRYLLMRVTLQS